MELLAFWLFDSQPREYFLFGNLNDFGSSSLVFLTVILQILLLQLSESGFLLRDIDVLWDKILQSVRLECFVGTILQQLRLLPFQLFLSLACSLTFEPQFTLLEVRIDGLFDRIDFNGD